jgi:hypothetical protein
LFEIGVIAGQQPPSVANDDRLAVMLVASEEIAHAVGIEMSDLRRRHETALLRSPP